MSDRILAGLYEVTGKDRREDSVEVRLRKRPSKPKPLDPIRAYEGPVSYLALDKQLAKDLDDEDVIEVWIRKVE